MSEDPENRVPLQPNNRFPAERPKLPELPGFLCWTAALWLVSLVSLVSLVCPAVAPAAEPPRTLHVVLDNAYVPYSFQSDTAESGKLQGILVDQWRLWEKKTGIKVEIHGADWNDALQRLRAGEFDVIDSIVETTERRAYFDFTPAYTPVEGSIFFRKDISGITGLTSLKGFPIGVKTGDQHIDKLKENGVTTLIPFPNDEALLTAAKERKINVFIADDPSGLYFLNKMGIAGDFRHSAPVFRDELRRAVRKGESALLRQVSEGFAAISSAELKAIDERWYGRDISRYGPFLIYTGYGAGAALLFIVALIAWNRTLQKGILQRTAELGESELRLRQIAENIREVFWMATPTMDEILYVSPAYESIWGRSLESLRCCPSSFFEAIHPEDRPHALDVFSTRRESGFDLEYRIVRPDGTRRWIRDRRFPVRDSSGQVYRIAGISDDITERKSALEAVKQAEDRTRLIVDTIPALAWSVRADGVVDFLNQRWLDYTGLTLERCVQDPLGSIHPDDVPRVVEKWSAQMAAGESYEDEMRLRRADGAYRWFLVHTVPLRDEQGNIVKWFGSTIDIEDRKGAEQLVRDSREQLRALSARLESLREEERIQIAREIHDDLGQKLTGLKMDLRRAERKIEGLESSPAVNSLLDTVVSATELVDGITVSVQEIAANLRPEMLDKLGLSAALHYEARRFHERTGVECQALLPEAEPDLVAEVSTTLFRIFQECLTNIARHAHATKVEASLQLDAGWATLRVEDNGRGLTEAEIASPESLGLLGMKERAALQGGEIVFQGRPGEGTLVEMRIPRSGGASIRES